MIYSGNDQNYYIWCSVIKWSVRKVQMCNPNIAPESRSLKSLNEIGFLPSYSFRANQNRKQRDWRAKKNYSQNLESVSNFIEFVMKMSRGEKAS